MKRGAGGATNMRSVLPVFLCSSLLAFSLLLTASVARAAVSADEAAKLGKDLTPLGAEKAASADGVIPAWDGGIATPPAGYQKGGAHVDPYAADKPLFTITA